MMIARRMLLLTVAAALTLSAAQVVVEPDNFAGGTDISSLTQRVTLVDAIDSADGFPSVFAVESTLDPSHGRVFGWLNPWMLASGWHNNAPLQVNFAQPVDYVEIEFISYFEGQQGELHVYDLNGALLETVVTGELLGNQRKRLTYSSAAANVGRIEAGSELGSIDVDRLAFNQPAAVPEPSTAGLLAGGAILALLRKPGASRR